MRVRIRVEWYVKNPDNPFDWSASPIDITAHVLPKTLRVKETIRKNEKSSFSFSVANPKNMLYDNEYVNGGFLAVGDKIMIYKWVGERDYTTSDLIFDGIITKVESVRNVDEGIVKVYGGSFSRLAFGAPVNMHYDGDSYNCVTLTQEIINRINLFRSQSPDYAKLHWYPGNPTTKQDGFPFPDLRDYSWSYKSFTEVMNEIWSSTYTDDGDYIWYIKKDISDGKYYFFVEPRTSTVPEENHIEEGSGEISSDGGYDETSIANVIIYNYGRDNKGNVLQRVYYNWASIMKYGPRWRYMTFDSESFDSLLLKEAKLQPDKFEWDGSVLKKRYPTSYPFTFSWGATANDDDEFNHELVQKATSLASNKVELVGKYLGFGKPTARFKYNSCEKNIDLGSLYVVNMPSRGIFNKVLRVVSVEYSYYTDTFELMSDVVEV